MIIVAGERSSIGLPTSSPHVTLSPDFEELACRTVDNRDVSNIYYPTVATISVVNTPPPAGNYNFPIVS